MTTRDAPAEELLAGCLLATRDMAIPAALRVGLRPQHWTGRYLALVYSRLIAPGGADAPMTTIAGDESLGRERLIRLYCAYHSWHEHIERGRFQRWIAKQEAGNLVPFPDVLHADVAATLAERVVRLARARGKLAEAHAIAEGEGPIRYQGGVQLIG